MDLRPRAAALLLTALLAGCAGARPEPGEVGHIDPDQEQEVLSAHRAETDACYARASAHGVGKVEIRVELDADGKVTTARVVMSTLEEPEVESCLVDALRGMRFPAVQNGSVAQLLVPFKFAPASPATR
jgi:TonB family protein